jgi:hypothetical protein
MRRIIISLVALSLFAPALIARDKPAPTAPGTYKEWGQDIDQIEIVKTFKIADYDHIVVQTFDTSASPLPDQKEKSYESIKSVLDGYTLTLIESLRPELKAKAAVAQSDKETKDAKTLILRGKVEDLSPGSRAKRYLGGFGAGAAGTKLSGEIVDAKSGTVLARFTQERRSGGTFKFAGGNDMDVMRDSIHAAGKDVAHILDAF